MLQSTEEHTVNKATRGSKLSVRLVAEVVSLASLMLPADLRLRICTEAPH